MFTFTFKFFEDTYLFGEAINTLGRILKRNSKLGPGKLGKNIWFRK